MTHFQRKANCYIHYNLVMNQFCDSQVHDLFSGIEDTESDDELISDSTACRPGLNITSAELVPRTSWRGKEKTELVAGTWKARSYDLNNIMFTFKTLQAEESNSNVENSNDEHDDNYNDDVILEEEDVMMPLRIREDDGDFLVADIAPPRRSCYEPRRRSRVAEETNEGRRRRSVDVAVPPPRLKEERNRWEKKVMDSIFSSRLFVQAHHVIYFQFTRQKDTISYVDNIFSEQLN
jgi:GPCR-chaperone